MSEEDLGSRRRRKCDFPCVFSINLKSAEEEGARGRRDPKSRRDWEAERRGGKRERERRDP